MRPLQLSGIVRGAVRNELSFSGTGARPLMSLQWHLWRRFALCLPLRFLTPRLPPLACALPSHLSPARWLHPR
eukprot:15138769-Heterocapsa_arctica.AAC.1